MRSRNATRRKPLEPEEIEALSWRYVVPDSYLEAARGKLELVDSMPPEIRRIVHEQGFEAGYAAFHQWRRARVRGGKVPAAPSTFTEIRQLSHAKPVRRR